MSLAKRNDDFVDLHFEGEKKHAEQHVIVWSAPMYLRERWKAALQGCGIEAFVTRNPVDLLKRVSRSWNGVVAIHADGAQTEGLNLLQRLTAIDSELPVVWVTPPGEMQRVVQAIRLGAYDVIEDAIDEQKRIFLLKRALEQRVRVLKARGRDCVVADQETTGDFFVGKSEATQRLLETLRSVAEVDADVLLIGETGTGKELGAKCLHELSPRRNAHFVPINCCAIPEDILESELFGHEPGAFTGAQRRRIGKFEHAQGGTVYLDEIDSMPLHLQGKLLRVLQERVIERLGSNRSIPVDIRVIASTKADLKEACAAGQFREDLFYRLNVISISLPPLRDHRDDIPMLFQYFVRQACSRYSRTAPAITSPVLSALMQKRWPGNVRELKNAAERFVLGYALDSVQGEDVACEPLAVDANQAEPLSEQIHAFEKSLIVQELSRTRGDVKATYTSLGLPRKTFYDKMKKYALKRRDFVERV